MEPPFWRAVDIGTITGEDGGTIIKHDWLSFAKAH